jgi:hypothetical protein
MLKMNNTTLFNLTSSELISIDPETTHGVYQEIYRRFLEEPAAFEEGWEAGFAEGFNSATETFEKLRDVVFTQTADAQMWSSLWRCRAALKVLHNIIEGEEESEAL